MQLRSLYTAALSLVTLVAIPAAASAAGGIVVPPGPTGKGNNANYQKMPYITQGLKFQKSQEVTIAGKKRLAVLFGPVIGTGSVVTLVAQDPKTHDNNADVESLVNHLKEGDVVNMNLEQIESQWNIIKAKIVPMKEGEDTPHGYVFKESYNEQGTGAALVRLTKYDISYEMVIPYVKDEKGQPQPDPDMVAAVTALKADQPVYVLSTPAGQKTLLTTIFPYKPLQTGKITKVSDQPMESGKTQAVDIETSDGKSVTALVPGKQMGKRFVPDPILKNTVHGMKPGTEVSFLTQDNNGKSFLVEITKLPPAPKTPAGSKPEKVAADK